MAGKQERPSFRISEPASREGHDATSRGNGLAKRGTGVLSASGMTPQVWNGTLDAACHDCHQLPSEVGRLIRGPLGVGWAMATEGQTMVIALASALQCMGQASSATGRSSRHTLGVRPSSGMRMLAFSRVNGRGEAQGALHVIVERGVSLRMDHISTSTHLLSSRFPVEGANENLSGLC
ncbi:hypothetical protein VTI74DRAFT_9457 [Chaetomium olivicolor]